MASYTTQLRTIVEQPTQYQSLPTRQRIEEGRKKLFDFDYPIFDESYRGVFETHFIRHFYMREIGFETEELFKFRLETWLIINMPYFNKLFESELIEYDPLINSKMNVTSNETNNKVQNDNRDTTRNETVDKDTTFTNDVDTTNSSTSNSQVDGSTTNDTTTNGTENVSTDDFNRSLKSDTPDSRLTLTANDGQGVIEYASEIVENTENNVHDATRNETSENAGTSSETASNTTNETGASNQTGSGTEDVVNNETKNDTLNSTINEVEDYVQERVGKIGVQSYAEMVMKYRQSFLRVEQQIFNEMNELFMLVY